jgi:hypothetical protein
VQGEFALEGLSVFSGVSFTLAAGVDGLAPKESVTDVESARRNRRESQARLQIVDGCSSGESRVRALGHLETVQWGD